ncbi:MAG: hypothetical protein ICV83_33150 [Cytophagales bacterium]|nr:hypothetical protein [Cytophagales bacterium]
MDEISESAAFILQHYKGRWHYKGGIHWFYKGQTRFEFDELDLLIDEDQVSYIQKLRGTAVKHHSFLRETTTSKQYVFFSLSGTDGENLFFIRYATETGMTCGECGAKRNTPQSIIWQVDVTRQ